VLLLLSRPSPTHPHTLKILLMGFWKARAALRMHAGADVAATAAGRRVSARRLVVPSPGQPRRGAAHRAPRGSRAAWGCTCW
jgi:hypothetical protein